MRFLEQARALYEEKGAPMLHARFPEYEARIAVGLCGRGSQCYGYDDALSRDHDYALGFCLWLTDEDEDEIGLALRRAYRALVPGSDSARSAMGGTGTGVFRIGDFFLPYTVSRGAPESLQQWLYLPSHALAEAVNGQVWRDELGVFSDIRDRLRHGMPEDVRRKKLAASLLIMAQAGQYNYPRCRKRGEEGAAMLALSEFVNAACQTVFLLNRSHKPYYKWCFRAMDELVILPQLRYTLEFLLTGENDAAGGRLKEQLVEDVCRTVIAQLQEQQLSTGSWDYLEPHALDLQQHISSAELRALHILEAYS